MFRYIVFGLRRRSLKLLYRLKASKVGISKLYPEFDFRSSDVILASFPKSGRNWIMFLLANTMLQVSGMDTEVSFLNIHDFIPEELPREPRIKGFPRIVATHGVHFGQPARSIYLLRHPADVMVSYYHYLRGRWNRDVGSFSNFIRDSRFGIPAWVKHVESWEGHWDILVRFEDLKRDALAQLRKAVNVLFNRDVDLEILETAVERSSFENMKRIEKEKGLPYKEGANPDYTFMRKGEYNRGQELFRQEDYILLNKTASHLLERYGYGRE